MRKTAEIPVSKIQKITLVILIAVFLLSFFIKPLGIFTFGLIHLFFFSFILFKFFIYLYSFEKVEDKPFKYDREHSTLPKYTVLLPVFREKEVVNKLVSRIDKLIWNKNQLEVFILVEHNDQETQIALEGKILPDYVKVLIVPPGPVQTKPHACHYATQFITGDYLVIYDAEDIPETDQLLKAYQKFLNSDERVVCLQAKLNYYNKDENWLAALFTVDYTTWFDGYIQGLSKLGLIIPLGGTSNHFKVKELREVQFWDYFSLVEDADLGIVLAENGYKTEILNSTTWEEAMISPSGWIKQRTRWTMGYMITCFVHLRGKIKMSFQDIVTTFLFIAGTPLSNLMVPVVYIVSICNYFFGWFDFLFVGEAANLISLTFWFGNGSMILVAMIACFRRGYYKHVLWCLLLPVYWLMSAIATYRGLYRIFTAPHFWEKSQHGLTKQELK